MKYHEFTFKIIVYDEINNFKWVYYDHKAFLTLKSQ